MFFLSILEIRAHCSTELGYPSSVEQCVHVLCLHVRALRYTNSVFRFMFCIANTEILNQVQQRSYLED